MPDIKSKLKRKLKKGDKEEKCGLILKGYRIIEVENTNLNKENSFRIDAKALIKHEDELIGTWHTHPNESANLSLDDYDGFRQWPRLQHYIVGIDGVRCFEVQNNFVIEV